jgi:hypothetical protein
MTKNKTVSISAAWTPQIGPQLRAIEAAWCDELLFGGARGGGKSDFLLGDFLHDVSHYGEAWQGVIFRRTVPELDELKKRAHQIYPLTGARWKEQKNEWVWPNKATLRMRHLERTLDAEKYRGHSYTWIGWDELTQWASGDAYLMIKACLRSGFDVPTKRIRSTANPGGAGHQWVKEYFIDPYPTGYKPIDDEESQSTRMFIPSRVQDNRILMERDPSYVNRLKGVGSPELVRAWLEGDWSVVTGSYFPEFNLARHVVAPVGLPKEWTRFRAMDWGFAAPYCCLWFAVSDGKMDEFPKNALVVYRESYGTSGGGKGVRMTAKDVGEKIIRMSRDEDIAYSVVDPSVWKQDSGPSIAEELRKVGMVGRPADNARVSGWNQLRQRLVGEGECPGIYIFSTCPHLIRTLPLMQHDENKPEDLDTTAEDHAVDALRYGCMSRPYATMSATKVSRIKTHKDITLNQLWAKSRPKRKPVRY